MTLRGPTTAVLLSLASFCPYSALAQGVDGAVADESDEREHEGTDLTTDEAQGGEDRAGTAEEESATNAGDEDGAVGDEDGAVGDDDDEDAAESRTTIVRDVRPDGLRRRSRSAGLDLDDVVDGASLKWWPWVASFSVGTLGLAIDTVTETPAPRWSSVGSADLGVTERLLLDSTGRVRAAQVSDVLLISGVLATYLDAALWRQDDRSNSRTSYRLLMMDSLVFSMNTALLALVKGTVRRQRPVGRYCAEDPEFGDCENRSLNRSFYSGHASTAFTAASLVCAHQRLRGQSALGRVECVGGLAVATSTAMLRIAAGKHYLSDVLVGATIGFLLGYIFPVYVFPRQLPVLPPETQLSGTDRHWW